MDRGEGGRGRGEDDDVDGIPECSAQPPSFQYSTLSLPSAASSV
jgi:hypothetical protein